MNFDTDMIVAHPTAPAVRGTDVRRAVKALVGSVEGDPASQPVDRSDDQLLAHLDTIFQPMLDSARAAATLTADPATPRRSPAERLLAEQQARRAGDMAALASFKAMRSPGLPRAVRAPATTPSQIARPRLEAGHRRPAPRVGLGPRLYVGFDAEWIETRKGHNRIISVQFVLYSPEGQTYERLFDLAGDHDIDQRLTLADALDTLLDEAEQECVFEHWPCEIVLLGFFLRGDLTAFADFKDLRHQLDGIGGTMGTVIRPAELTLPMDATRCSRLKSRYQRVLGDGFDPRLMKVRILDVSRLTPPGTSLAHVGDWLGEPKIELPRGYDKADMLRFKRQQPEKFKAYALHDARLAMLFGLWVLWFSDRLLGLKGLSATVSGLAVRLAELCMRRDGVHPDVALNFEWVTRQRWSAKLQRVQTIKERVPSDIRRWLEPFLADVYQGGRNESYLFGPTEVGHWYDSDLSGAYVTGLAVFMALDYEQVRLTTEISDFIGHVAGFAQVRFRFPSSTRFPCLPVQVGEGLWFPLEGTSLCTSPEIELALAMGAELQIRFGIVIGWKERSRVMSESQPRLQQWQASRDKQLRRLDAEPTESEDGLLDVLVAPDEMSFPPPDHGDIGYRPMESFAIFVRQMRLQYRRKSLPFEFMKLVGNGLYGKTGQGFKGKRGTRLRDLESTPIGMSRVSEAAIAALVCGFVRATVSEILFKLPSETRVVSLTTDGALMDMPTDQLDLSGPICQRYQALVDRVAPGTPMIEPKHQVRQAFVPRTRGCFTVEADVDEFGQPHPVMCAKAGHKVVIADDASEADQARLRTPAGESDWMIRLALNRQAGQKLPQESFFSLRDQLANDWDLQMQQREVKVSLEYDFKRRPVNPRMVRMAPYESEHLAFDTEPWTTTTEGEQVREIFRQWHEQHCLKTLEDWARWQVFLTHHLGNQRRRQGSSAVVSNDTRRLRGRTGQKHLRGGDAGMLRLVVRTFLQAFTQGVWGLAGEKDCWTYKELARWLTGLGYAVTENDVKNAGRSRIDEGIAADTPDVRQFLDRMKEDFQSLEIERFFASI